MKRVVIIGAGPAGLTAAKELLAGNEPYDITILEESSEIGGISRTVRYEGNRMDIGGHRFFSKSDEIMQRWAQWMPLQGAPSFDDARLGREKPLAQGGPDPEKEDRVMLVRDRVSRIYYGNHFFDYPISMKWETIRNMGFATTVKAGFSYLKAMVVKKPETNLENFYINRFGKVLYSMFFEGYTEKLWGRHPSEIAADWGAQRVKGLSILSLLKNMLPKGKNAEVETSLIEQFWYPKFGPGQLWETLAADVQALGAMCGGALTLLRFPLDAAGLLYMEGAHSRGLEQNRQFRGQWYYGRLLIVGVAPYGVRFRSLTPEQIAMYMAKWREAVVPYEKVRWPG